MNSIFDSGVEAGDIIHIQKGKYTFKCVCSCQICPEQWDVYIDEHVVGYLRLRWGYFKAAFPDASGEIIYETSRILGDGCFDNGKERMREMKRAIKAIHKEVKKLERYVPSPEV
jgi:hypothetical protein